MAASNVSTFGFVHSKLWNQLDFIKTNSSQFENHVFQDDVQDIDGDEE
jgi:hypothetical protein